MCKMRTKCGTWRKKMNASQIEGRSSVPRTRPLLWIGISRQDHSGEPFAKISFAHQVRTIHQVAMQDFKSFRTNKVTADALNERLQQVCFSRSPY
jgi:hypothetical protein